MAPIREHDYSDYPEEYRPKRDVRNTKWMITFNNWTEAGRLRLVNDVKYIWLIYAEEIAPTTGTPHLQGFALFREKVRWTALCKQVR